MKKKMGWLKHPAVGREEAGMEGGRRVLDQGGTAASQGPKGFRGISTGAQKGLSGKRGSVATPRDRGYTKKRPWNS